MRKQANRGALLRYIGALLLFGSNGVVASRIALSSEQIVLLRTLIGTVALAGFFFLGRNKLRFFRYKGDFLFLMLSGLVMGIHWIFLYEAYRQVGVGVATLLCYCGPVIVMALSGLVFGERLTRWKLAGFAAVLLGVFLLNWEPPGQELNRFGIFCGVMSAVLYAGMIILNKKAARIQGVENSMLQLLFAFTAVAVVVVLRGELPPWNQHGQLAMDSDAGVVQHRCGLRALFFFHWQTAGADGVGGWLSGAGLGGLVWYGVFASGAGPCGLGRGGADSRRRRFRGAVPGRE